MKAEYASKQPLKQETPLEDVTKSAVWLMSNYALGITGQVINSKELGIVLIYSRWRLFYFVICLLNKKEKYMKNCTNV